jgi:hypothetical protein
MRSPTTVIFFSSQLPSGTKGPKFAFFRAFRGRKKLKKALILREEDEE